MPSHAATDLPAFRLGSSGLPGDQGFEAWRQIMARMFLVDRHHAVRSLPRGEMSAVLLGDIMANRSLFTAARVSRDDRRISATPDHLVLQLYRSGGYAGEIGGRPARISRGQIAVCDLRRRLDVQARTSETIGLSIPRHVLDGIDLDNVPARLDPVRERLLAARMTMLHLRLPSLAASDAATEASELVSVLRRLFDPSAAGDVLEGRELDDDLVALADQVIIEALGSRDLSPAMIADRLRVSRTTLFRAFVPHGGIEGHIWDMRLRAVRAALEQPARRRTLSSIGNSFGFKTASHLSRRFRTRYGITPSEWRARQATDPAIDRDDEVNRLVGSWRTLGR